MKQVGKLGPRFVPRSAKMEACYDWARQDWSFVMKQPPTPSHSDGAFPTSRRSPQHSRAFSDLRAGGASRIIHDERGECAHDAFLDIVIHFHDERNPLSQTTRILDSKAFVLQRGPWDS